MSTKTGHTPSQLLDIDALCSAELGYPSSWVSYQVDDAILWFGMYVESKLNETYKDGRGNLQYKYTLPELLRSKRENTQLSLEKAFATGRVVKRSS